MNIPFLFKYMILEEPAKLIISIFCVTFWYCSIAMWIAEKAI